MGANLEPSPATPAVTIIDVLEGYFGETPDEAAVRALNQPEIEELGDLAVQFATAQVGTPAPKGAVYPGGWLAGNWHDQLFRGDLSLALLYYPSLLVHDPLADFFSSNYGSLPPTRDLREKNNRMTIISGPAIWGQPESYEGMRSNMDVVRDHLVNVITLLVDAAPMLRTCALVTRSQWPTILDRSQALMTSVRHDVRSQDMQAAVAGAAAAGTPPATWDNMRGMNALPASGLRASDEPWKWQHEFFYLAKTLAVADAAGATYAPPTDGDLAVLRAKVAGAQRAVMGDRQPLEFIAEVARVLVPDLQLDARTAVAMRASEEAFDDWHRGLRSLARAVDNTASELRERVEDELLPKVRRVERAISRSAVSRRALREQAATTLITGAAAVGAANLAGANPWITGTATVASGAMLWAWKAYRPPSLGGEDAVLASLIRAAPA